MYIMMQLGLFPFSINTAAYQELTRSSNFRWPAQDLFGKTPTRQFTGPGEDSMTLQGVIYPEFRGGHAQLDALRLLAKNGEPMILVTGLGEVLGRWVIEKIDEQQSVFAKFGIPRKQGFTVSLQYFDEADMADLLESFVEGVDSLADGLGLTEELAAVKASVSELADQAVSAANNGISSLSSALSGLQESAGVIGPDAAPVVLDVQNGIRLASDLRDISQQVSSTLSKVSVVTAFSPQLSRISQAAARAANAGAAASTAATKLLGKMDTGTADQAAMKNVRAAVTASGTLATGSGRVFATANKLAGKLA